MDEQYTRETETEVTVVRVDCICDECEDGHMSPTGIMFTVNPPKYQHECNKCGFTRNYLKQYPSIEYR